MWHIKQEPVQYKAMEYWTIWLSHLLGMYVSIHNNNKKCDGKEIASAITILEPAVMFVVGVIV